MIKDSGNRREFESGAVRDIQEGKGRCDLLPLDVVAIFKGNILTDISQYQETGRTIHLTTALQRFIDKHGSKDMSTTFLEVSKHFEEGAKKYGEYNWQKGIPTHCYIDSAVRHYLKYLRGDTDEPHDRAFVWNILCCIWTCIHKPELNDYAPKGEEDNA
ncbi:MAG: dATP/dGTP diphosphohydrolase domain-containing protein [Acutalibacteraceae bacterium]|nr:dATP/dGTP diphosphohydrolase domain-containing protein [Acutalibacteraceae bacterium]